ncbi:MAG TPA: carboxypeptidase-like regulatory domain-containing protein [Hymenobacter sp.]|uniref:carboxypeptidase-like regulatory domain-containing protein n=1 Tax=Hymenobacter sp. TaxID=1898978 RepID=UPI002D7F2D43|nr:carboxypeptidase-like regulatory domain-containing protein [Hymenobacter sp.]HET9505515.1 carboxypeptidase-like regulatory domain-containing protein [Hymenobacter sp.]
MFSHHLSLALAAAGTLLASPAHAEAGPAPAVATPAATVAAPRTIVLAGTIMGPQGQPCAGACVFPTFNPRLIAVTDAAGNFRLLVPAPDGPLYVQADYVGLGSRRVAVDAQHPQPIRIALGE